MIVITYKRTTNCSQSSIEIMNKMWNKIRKKLTSNLAGMIFLRLLVKTKINGLNHGISQRRTSVNWEGLKKFLEHVQTGFVSNILE